MAVQRVIEDALRHEQMAKMISAHLGSLPLGSVVALHGSWGSGKTDTLRRVFDSWLPSDSSGPKPLWLNPWKYGTPDLITPVVLQLLGRLEPKERNTNKRLRRLAETLVRAGSAMAFKAVTVVAPFGEVFGAAQSPVDDYLRSLFQSDLPTSESDVDLDPVAEVADRFKELVDEYVRIVPDPTRRLIVCVDDLDRCLPDHQIAMLEAIHFLTASGAACQFLVALDPMLVQQAAETHYRTKGFDSSRYLDKLFDLRITLPYLEPTKIVPLARGLVEGAPQSTAVPSTFAEQMPRAFGVDAARAADAFARVFFFPELTNPRLIVRTVERLRLLASALVLSDDMRLMDEQWFHPLVVWTAIAERWPQLRQLLQAFPSDGWLANIQLIAYHYGLTERSSEELGVIAGELSEANERKITRLLEGGRNVLARLPDETQSPDLGSFLDTLVLDYNSGAMIAQLQHCDRVYQDYGL